MFDRFQHLLLNEFGPEKRALGAAGGTEGSCLAAQSEELLGAAIGAFEAGEAPQKNAALEVLPDDLVDDAAPPAVLLLEAFFVGGLCRSGGRQARGTRPAAPAA